MSVPTVIRARPAFEATTDPVSGGAGCIEPHGLTDGGGEVVFQELTEALQGVRP